MSSILVVDDNRDVAAFCCQLLSEAGHETIPAYSGDEALAILRERPIDIVVSDVCMPGLSGIDLLPLAIAAPSSPDVILITGFGSVRDAVTAVKQGAFDYIEKPIDPAELVRLVRQLMEVRARRASAHEISPAEARDSFGIVGNSPAIQSLLRWIPQVAGRGQPILITGEHGTGKKLTARAIHEQSPFSNLPFVVLHSSSSPDAAVSAGTLFLDEISEFPLETQARLYRDLQERRISARVIASSTRDLSSEIRTGQMRQDLYYRLNVHAIDLPPLRARREDIPALAEYFLGGHIEGGRYKLAPDTLAILQEYEWPGNVRELENCIIAMLAHADGPVLGPGLLPPALHNFAAQRSDRGPLQAAERSALVQALKLAGGRVGEAAIKLGVSQATLYRKLAANGLRAGDFRSPDSPPDKSESRASGSN